MKIYKLLVAACVATFATSVTTAQTVVAAQETTEETVFNPHWFMQIQAGAAYTLGENGTFGDLVSPAAAVSAGYRFNPLFSLRAGVSGWEGKGSWVSPRYNYKFNYLQGNVDAMLSITNLFCGYNPNRTLDFYGFLGAGVAVGFNNHEVTDLTLLGCDFDRRWKGHRAFIAGRGGLGVNINLSRHIAINVEVNANMLPDRFNSKSGSKADWQFNALAGITYCFGSKTKKIIKATEIVESIPVPAPEPEPAPAPAPEPAPQPKAEPIEVAKVEPITRDIFFTLNSSFINSDQQEKIDSLVEFMKANPGTKVTVTGYADKATGNARYNMTLSERRANAVAKAIEKAGIEPSRIITDAKGDTVQPFDTAKKNRVAIAVTQ